MIRFALTGLVRAPLRTLVRVATLAAAVALLAAMLLFIGHSLRTMTGGAVRSVPLDWQGPVASAHVATRVAADVARQPGVAAAQPAATAPFAAIDHVSRDAGQIRAGAGAILAVDSAYPQAFHTLRFLRGGFAPDGVVLDQQLAATLQAQPGDTVSLYPRRSGAPVRLRVSGIALVTASDVVFQPLNPLVGPAPQAPPANVAVMAISTFATKIAPHLPAVSNASTAAPGTLSGTQWQVVAQADPHVFTGSPAHALLQATQLRNRIERTLPGRVAFVDNLSDSLNGAAGDALYAETLYIMLAAPGAIVALGLAYLAALGTVERDRRDLALLRARGATRRDVLILAVTESVVLGLVAGGLGTLLALLCLRWSGSDHGVTALRALTAFGICAGVAAVGAFAARVGTSLAAYGASIGEGRRSVRREQRPLWQRLYLDIVLLVLAGLVYLLTIRTGFSAVVNPDSNPTLSLSVYMFLAPAFLWLGATLLLLRLRGRAVSALARAAASRGRSWPRFLLASAGRRGHALNRGLVIVGLLLAFGVELGVFTATYDQQARVDAQLTLGADVTVTTPAGVNVQQRVAKTPGVVGTTAVDHSYAYVGPDLQDTFGIDPATFTNGSSLRDSYFLGSSAKGALDRLRVTRDGILVSRETITDYQLNLNDLLRLRVLDHRTGTYRVAPFHVVGIVQEFPSAPKDSFMVTNLAYLRSVTHDPGPNVVFAKTKGDPAVVAQRVSAATASAGGEVRSISEQTAQTVSSITTVDLRGITRIEEVFAVVLAAAAMALFVAVGLNERRHELATMAALGATLRQAAAFLWSEAALVLAGALALAALLGWLLAEMLVALLQHVFDPPPDHLAAPWRFLLGLGAAAVVGGIATALLAAASIRRLPLGAVLRENE